MDLSARFGCSFLQAALMEMRGIGPDSSQDEVNSWISPDMEMLLQATSLGESNSFAADVFRKLSESSSVVVYGDYDVDGISATSIALSMVLHKKAQVRYFIPHRFRQGYGLHKDIARFISNRSCDLVIVVDCGSQDAEAVELIKESGTPVVVFDHHLVDGRLAECDTLVNPQVSGGPLSKNLCAAGVIWVWAWQNELLPKDILLSMLDLVALATIADCVSLSSPLNRVLVNAGIEILRTKPRLGLATLIEKLGLTPSSLTTEDLSMKIIPCLNAAGRLFFADLAMKIIFPDDNLAQNVDKLIALNRKRRELSTKILEQAALCGDDGFQYVLTNEDWSVGVLSSVASRICAERNSPVALVAPVGEIMRGTLRMPKGGDAVGVLKELSPSLKEWGGHRLAAGFSVKTEKWHAVRKEMEALMSEMEIEPEKEELLYWTPDELDMRTWIGAETLGPFGMGNPYPKLYSPYDGQITVSSLGKTGKHVKINLGDSTLLAFGAADVIRDRESLAGWVYKPRIDTWRNIPSLQLVLEKMVVI